MLIVDLIGPLKRCYESPEDQKETFWQAIKQTWNECKYLGFVNLFLYRGFINSRAMIYSYLVVMYDLNQVYLQLTLIRGVLSWIGALLLLLIIPKFIGADASERQTVLYWPNLLFKTLGTVAVVTSFVLLSQ